MRARSPRRVLRRLSENSDLRFPEGRRHLALARSWVAYGLGPLVGVVTAPILARALGPEGRGTLAAVLQPMTVADSLAVIGLPAAVTYFVARRGSPREVIRAAIPTVVASSTVVTVLLVIWALHLSNGDVLPLWLTLPPWCVVVASGAFVALRRSAWQGLDRLALLDIERASSAVLRLMLIILAFAIGVVAAGAYVWLYLAAGVLSWSFLFKRFPAGSRSGTSPPVAPRFSLDVRNYALYSSVGTISAALANRLDQAILPGVMPLRDLGLYSVAVTLAEVPVILTTVIARNVLTSSARGESGIKIARSAGIASFAVALVSATIFVFAPQFVVLAFGNDFLGASSAVRILCVSSTLSIVGVASSAYLAGSGSPLRGSSAPAVGALATVAIYGGFFRHDVSLSEASWINVLVQSVTVVVSIVQLQRFYSVTNRSGIQAQ